MSFSGSYTDTKNKESDKELTYTPKYNLGLDIDYKHQEYKFGVNCGIDYLGKQYTDSGNTQSIDAHTLVDIKLYKSLGGQAKLALEVDNLFNSDKGDEGSFRTERTYVLKLSSSFESSFFSACNTF